MHGNTGEIEFLSANSLRSVQRLLWDVINERLREAERDEVKRAVGTLVIEDNQALFAEAAALAEILGDVQLNTSALLHRKQLCSNPERNMVEADILLVMDRLRSMVTSAMFAHSSAKERNPDSIVPKTNSTDKAIYEYMQASTALQSVQERPTTAWLRPSTASSRPPTASTLSRPSTASSTTSINPLAAPDASQLMECVQGKLSIFSIDEVKDAIRCALNEEHSALMNDIDYLTALLTDEADLQLKASAPPPSLQELKQYSHKLKSLVQSEQTRLQHEVVVSRMFDAAQAEPSKAGRLRRMVGASREGPAAPGMPLLNPPPVSMPRNLMERPLSAARTSPNQLGLSPRVSASNRPPSQGSQQGDSILTGVMAPHPQSLSATTTQSGVDFPSAGHLQPEQSGMDSPDSAQAAALSSSLSGSIMSAADMQPARVQSAPHQHVLPASSLAAVPVPAVQRTGSGRRHLIHALRASSASRVQDQEGLPNRTREEQQTHQPQQPMLVRSPSTTLQEVQQFSPGHIPSKARPGQVPKLLPGDLLDARAEVLKGGVAAILAKYQYQPRSKQEPG